MQFPDDDNGKMLAAMVESGIDLSKPLDVDFFLLFEDKRDADVAYENLPSLDLKAVIELNLNDEIGKWELIVCVNMVPEYDLLVERESFLNDFAHDFGGMSDGWGVMQHQEGDDAFSDDDHQCGDDCKH